MGLTLFILPKSDILKVIPRREKGDSLASERSFY